jgi:hypothetical protein
LSSIRAKSAILSDIDEAIPRPGPSGTLIPNIYILEWRKHVPPDYTPAREKLIAVEEGRSVRIKAIESEEFGWVFSAFGSATDTVTTTILPVSSFPAGVAANPDGTKVYVANSQQFPRKRTHQFIQQRIAARFQFTRIRIRGALSHDIEIAPPVGRTPRLILAAMSGRWLDPDGLHVRPTD